MKYWVLMEIPYTGGNPDGAAMEVMRAVVSDRCDGVEPHVTVGFPKEGISKTTFEVEADHPLAALSTSISAMYVALEKTGQEADWDMARTVIRLAPSAEAMYMYRVTQPVALPPGYDGPTIDWTPTL